MMNMTDFFEIKMWLITPDPNKREVISLVDSLRLIHPTQLSALMNPLSLFLGATERS